MKKYLLVELAVLIVILLGLIFTISFMENPNNKGTITIKAFSDLSPSRFNQALGSGEFKLIDVRTADEYSAGHIKNAKDEDFYQTQKFESFLDSLDKNGRYLVYCKTGIRSGQVLKLMQQKGFKTVYDLAGGYNAWVTNSLPVEK
jgi:rhodanese-related sulfurtransferase